MRPGWKFSVKKIESIPEDPRPEIGPPHLRMAAKRRQHPSRPDPIPRALNLRGSRRHPKSLHHLAEAGRRRQSPWIVIGDVLEGWAIVAQSKE